MYHDQDHGPVKALGIESGVKIMIGLQVIGLERQNRVELLR
jgi:4-hydroxy-L-threonine phosphate dehydrogenase PdxA